MKKKTLKKASKQLTMPHAESRDDAKAGKVKKPTNGLEIVPGEGMPRAHRNKVAPEVVKIAKARGSKFKIGNIVLDVAANPIDAGRDGFIYLIPKLVPRQCRLLLGRVPKGQRGLRNENVARYSRDMKNGRFVWTGDTIKIDARGCLIDGQHRLAAAARVNHTLTNVLLAVVLKKGSIANMDEGARRSIRDRRLILGKRVHDFSVNASVSYEASKPDWSEHTRRAISNEELDHMIDAVPFLDEIQGFYHTGKRTYGRMDSAMGAVAIRCMYKHKTDARAFFSAVAENSHSIDGKEIPQLKQACNYMMQVAMAYKEGVAEGDTRRRRTQTTHKLIEAWNSWRGGKPLASPWRYIRGTIPTVI